MTMDFEIIHETALPSDNLSDEKMVLKVNLEGSIDLYSSDEIWFFFKTMVQGGVRKIILDVHALEYIDSAGIGVVIKTTKLLRVHKGDIAVINVTPNIEKLFKLINLQRFIKLSSSEDMALQYLRLNER